MKGKITITRNSDDVIKIAIEDESSSIDFLECRMTPEEFALAITGLSYRPIDFNLRGVDKVGKKLEVKKERIPYKWELGKSFMDDMRKLVAPYEIDGWKAERIETFNSHMSNNGKYTVNFRRYVDIATQLE